MVMPVRGSKATLALSRGGQYHKNQTTFKVYAPHAKEVTLCLTQNSKIESRQALLRGPDGIWQIDAQASPGQSYLYLITDCDGHEMLRVDPFSYSVSYDKKNRRIESVV